MRSGGGGGGGAGAETGAASWLPETKSTECRRNAISVTEGTTLRDELRAQFVNRGPNVVRWGDAIQEWREYIQETAASSLVFEEVTTGQRSYARRAHRWDVDYQRKQYAQLKDMERGIQEFYGRAWTGLITLTASSDVVPHPVDHLQELLSGREAALAALRRSLSDRTWDYWWVLEPHKSGYLHLHLAVVVEGRIGPSDLQPAVDSHLRQVNAAGQEAHQEAVEVRRGSEIENLGAYLNSYLGQYEEDPLEADEHIQAANAILWAAERRQTGASDRLREFMQWDAPDDPVEGDWQLTAILDPEGKERPVDPDVPGSVDRFELEVRYPDSPPDP